MAKNSPGSWFNAGDGNPLDYGFLNGLGGAFGQIIAGDQDFIPEMVNELSGYNSQQREFEQQDKLLEKQQEFADERNQMRRMQEAGINPLTAASNITGQSPSAPSVPASSGAPAAGLGAVAGAAESVGTIADKVSAARERNYLLEERKKNLISDTFLKYKEAGYDDAMAKNLAIANAYLPTEKFLGLVTMSENINNLRGEYKVMMQDIENKKKQIEEMDAQIKLYEAQGNMADALSLQANKNSLLLEAKTIEQNWYNNQMSSLDIDPRNPIESNIFMLGIKGNSGYETGLGILRDVKYKEATGQYDADEEHAFSVSYKKESAKALASWLGMPNSPWSGVSQGLKGIREKLRAGKITREQAHAEVRQHNQFVQSFNAFKAQLKKNLEEKRRAYKEACRHYGQDERNRTWQEYQNALRAYDMDIDEYSDLLLGQ